MEREYAKTPDLSRGQGTGMQSFEREIGKHWSNVISLRWEYLQLSRNFSRLWLLCPCDRFGTPVWADELEGAAPAIACIKCVSDRLMPTRHKLFGRAPMAIQAATHTVLAVLLPTCVSMGLCIAALPCVPSTSHKDHDAYSTLASQGVKFLSSQSYLVWHLQITNFLLEAFFSSMCILHGTKTQIRFTWFQECFHKSWLGILI